MHVRRHVYITDYSVVLSEVMPNAIVLLAHVHIYSGNLPGNALAIGITLVILY